MLPYPIIPTFIQMPPPCETPIMLPGQTHTGYRSCFSHVLWVLGQRLLPLAFLHRRTPAAEISSDFFSSFMEQAPLCGAATIKLSDRWPGSNCHHQQKGSPLWWSFLLVKSAVSQRMANYFKDKIQFRDFLPRRVDPRLFCRQV